MHFSFSPRTLFLLFCGLICFSQVFAQQWQQVTALPSTPMTAFFSQGDTLYVAGPNKVYFTYDGGQTWDSTAVMDLDFNYIETLYFIKDRLYAGTGIDGVFRSDNGQTWQEDNTGISGAGAHSISRLDSRGDSLYAGTYGSGVFVKRLSTNSSWSTYNSGLPWVNVESLTNIDGKLFAGAGGNATVSQQAYPSNSWMEVPFDEFNGALNIFLDVIQVGDILLGAGTLGLYRSTDFGGSWGYIPTGLGVMEIARFVEVNGRVLVKLVKPGGLPFILYTDDKGLNWESFQHQITGSIGYDLAFLNGQLYSAQSSGLWRIALTTATQEPESPETGLSQNFPNPFLGATTIPVQLPKADWIELAVFDGRGSKMATIWKGYKPAGKHEFYFDASALLPGLYYCRLNTSSSVQSLRMMLVK